ncbi:E3 SUMO-protein ligase ZBED1-like [Macrosteles quadrilineatus]|nr:E3 SUMO-protein ligase ZBED1-like [Macrosteles quadrilineatus]
MSFYAEDNPPASIGSSTSGGPKEGLPEMSLWGHLQSLSQRTRPSSKEDAVKQHVQAYINSPCIPMQENPCSWWKQHSQLYGPIASVAKRYLGIPATEVASERIFSSAGNVVNERRRCLTQEHISELVFLHHNIDI